MANFDEVQTDRLLFTRICLRDVVDVRKLHGDADVMATLGGVRTPEQTQTTVEILSQHWEEHGFGPWIAREVGSGVIVGMGGLRRLIVDEVAEIEIGYALVPRFGASVWQSNWQRRPPMLALAFLTCLLW
jgi:RimJ/RimL family protein N-acetyltransferase